jgi:hypothetical protein
MPSSISCQFAMACLPLGDLPDFSVAGLCADIVRDLNASALKAAKGQSVPIICSSIRSILKSGPDWHKTGVYRKKQDANLIAMHRRNGAFLVL